MPTLFAVTVDTEEEWDWKAGFPTTAPSVSNIELLPQFQAICSRHGAAVTYFTNHAVMKDAAASRILLDVARDDRVEIGMHIHPWNTPPLAKGSYVSPRESFLHNLSADLARAKLETVYGAFVEHGLSPTSFRGGRYSSGGIIHQYLVQRGFLADASAVPFTRWSDQGAPDYRRRNLQPLRLLPTNESPAPLWDIPLTLAFTRGPHAVWGAVYNTIESTPLRYLRLIGIAERMNVVRRVWLSFEDPLGEEMVPWLKRLQQLDLPCICFTLHSSSLKVGANGCYSRDQAQQRRLLDQVDHVLSMLARLPDFQPATISEIAHHLERQYHAHSWN